uniref:Variant surface glycoprotein 1958 n=1 Tax=Trypanosoma brucei TaxID=5691 RepID=M4TCW0_9TRYP|nr:variant surface glycoprotein 1958 [Trypanosoma brucei]
MNLAALVLIFATAKTTTAADNSNTAEFNSLCKLIGLKKRAESIGVASPNTDVEGAMDELAMLNLTAATETWLTDKNGELSKKSDAAAKSALTEWQTNVKKIEEKDPATGKPKYRKVRNNHRKPGVAAAIARLYDEATRLKADLQKPAADAAETKSAVMKLINDAIFGEGHTDFTKTGLDTSYTNNCKSEGGGRAGKCIAWDLLCTCSSTSANGIRLCLQAESGGQLTNFATTTAAATHYQALIEKCPKRATTNGLTAAEIEEAVAAVQNLLGRQATAATAGSAQYVLGQPHSDGNCDGSSDQGVCVNYKQYLETNDNDIPWVTKLNQAAQRLQEGYEAQRQAAIIAEKISTLRQSAWTLHTGVINEADTPTPQNTAVSDQQTSDAETECNKKADQKACEKPCTWNGGAKEPNKKCTLSEEAKRRQNKQTKKGKAEKRKKSVQGKSKNTAKMD